MWTMGFMLSLFLLKLFMSFETEKKWDLKRAVILDMDNASNELKRLETLCGIMIRFISSGEHQD